MRQERSISHCGFLFHRPKPFGEWRQFGVEDEEWDSQVQPEQKEWGEEVTARSPFHCPWLKKMMEWRIGREEKEFWGPRVVWTQILLARVWQTLGEERM